MAWVWLMDFTGDFLNVKQVLVRAGANYGKLLKDFASMCT